LIGSAKRYDQVAIDTDMNPADGDVAADLTKIIALDTMDTSNAFTQTKTHHQFTKEKPLMPYITVGQENLQTLISTTKIWEQGNRCTDSWISIEWTFLGEVVLKRRYRVITYDRRGFALLANPHLAMTTIPSQQI